MSYDLSIAQLRGTAAQLRATNSTVAAGRLCKETDTGRWKSGTGLAYNSEAYILLDGEEGKNADVAYDVMTLSDSRDEAGIGGASAWGDITGTLSDQLDLNSALETMTNGLGQEVSDRIAEGAALDAAKADASAVTAALALKADAASLPKRYLFTGDSGAATGTIGVNTFPMAVTVTYPGTGVYRFTAASGTPFTVGKTNVGVIVVDAYNPLGHKLTQLDSTTVYIEIFNTTTGTPEDPAASYIVSIETEP